MTRAEQVAAAARALVGVRFRAQGRDPALGLDCVGIAAVALRAAGVSVDVPAGYALRTADWPLAAAPDGVADCDGTRAGDVLLCRIAASQLHVAVRTDGGFVHADVGLRRVVERPEAPPWPVIAAWRVIEEED